jgi:hypothetical protein
MAAKPVSIADRIRLQRQKNRPDKEALEEAAIIKSLSIPVLKEQSNGQSGGQSGGQSNGLTDSLTDSLADSLTDSHKNTLINSLKGSLSGTLPPCPDSPFFWMTNNQRLVLEFLITIPGGKTRLADICASTGVPYGTARKAIDVLERNRCITKPKKLRIGQWQGFFIEVLEEGKRWPKIKGTLADSLKGTLAGGHSGGHSGGQSTNSSSSFIKETTTYSEAQHKLVSTPELGYWRQKGLTAKQLESWSQQFRVTIDSVFESLSFCAFDMVDNAKETKDSIKDVFSWFFRIFERTGGYPRPGNYRSHSEKEIAKEKARIDELRRQSEELKSLREDAVKAEMDLEFERMLNDPDSQRYKKCFENVRDIAKTANRRGSSAIFLADMRRAFEEIYGDGVLLQGENS